MSKSVYPKLDLDTIQRGLLRVDVDEVHIFSTVDSTNECCKNLYKKGVRKNTLVIANQQSQGRGRRSRSFSSPKDGFYASLLYFPKDLSVKQLQLVTICAVLAVCKSIEKLYDIDLDIKWLNDVYLNGKKLAGILAEAQFKGNEYAYIIIGIGINTYDFLLPRELQEKVSSIEKETGVIVDRNLLIPDIFANLFDYLIRVKNNDKSLIDEYEKRNFLIGRVVTLDEDEHEYFKVCGVDAMGHLIVESEQGEKILNAEEVKLHGW